MNFDNLDEDKEVFIEEYLRSNPNATDEEIENAWSNMLDELCQVQSEIEIWSK